MAVTLACFLINRFGNGFFGHVYPCVVTHWVSVGRVPHDSVDQFHDVNDLRYRLVRKEPAFQHGFPVLFGNAFSAPADSAAPIPVMIDLSGFHLGNTTLYTAPADLDGF